MNAAKREFYSCYRVHIVGAIEKLLYNEKAVLQRQRQHTHCRAAGESAADPIPKAEHVVSADTKRNRLGNRRARSGEMENYRESWNSKTRNRGMPGTSQPPYVVG